MKSISLAAAAALAFSGSALAQTAQVDHSAHQAAPAKAQPAKAQPATPAQRAQPAPGQGQAAQPATPAQPAQPAQPGAAGQDETAPAQTEAEIAATAQATADAQLTPEVRKAQGELMRVIGELQSGNVDYSKFHPQLAAAIQPQQPAMTPGLAKLGKVEQVRYKGLGEHGRHQFEVQFGTDTTKATTNWFIGFDDTGKINGFEFR